MIDEAGNSTVQLGGSVIDSNLSNSATVERQGMSLGLGGEKGSGLPNLSLPTHSDDSTDSTTYAVTDGIAFTRPDGSTVGHIRSELEGANAVLADPNEQDHNALAIFAGTLLSVEITDRIGDYAAGLDAGAQRDQGW